LVARLPESARPQLSDAECFLLNSYAVEIRYPDNLDEDAQVDAASAIKIARRIRREIGKALPVSSLRG
jgi:hypothetical protein